MAKTRSNKKGLKRTRRYRKGGMDRLVTAFLRGKRGPNLVGRGVSLTHKSFEDRKETRAKRRGSTSRAFTLPTPRDFAFLILVCFFAVLIGQHQPLPDSTESPSNVVSSLQSTDQQKIIEASYKLVPNLPGSHQPLTSDSIKKGIKYLKEATPPQLNQLLTEAKQSSETK